jgi:integrase
MSDVKIKARSWTYKGEPRTGLQAVFSHPVTKARVRITVPTEVAEQGKKAARAWGEDQREALRTGTPAESAPTAKDEPLADTSKPGTMTVKEYVDEYLPKDLADKRFGTKETRVSVAKNHIVPKLGDRTLASLTRADLKDFQVALLAEGKKVGTANMYGMTLHTMLVGAEARGFLTSVPKISKVKDNRPQSDDGGDGDDKVAGNFWTGPEADKVIAAANADKEPLWLMMMTGVHTGMRPGELRALKVHNVDLEKRIIRVRSTAAVGGNTPGKNAGAKRDIPMSAPLYAAMKEYLAGRDQNAYVFGTGDNPVDKKKYADAITKAAATAGVKRITAHGLRHTFATHYLHVRQSGSALVELQKLMGHADLKSTLIYVHDNAESRREGIAEVFGGKDATVLQFKGTPPAQAPA